MLSSRRLSAILLAFALLALLVPASAPAAKKASPKITSVTPMRVTIGTNMTIRGSGFSSSRSRNTIIFRAPNGRTAFVKPRAASRRKLSFRVPSAVNRLLSLKNGKAAPTRFKLRVLSGRFGNYTVKRLSPVVVPLGSGGIGGPGSPGGALAPCGSGDDWDGDLLSNGTEFGIGTDPCLKDTDLDGAEDGYEYQSSIDLNHYPASPPLPYPARRPYPNALDPSDPGTDYDGDGLGLREEFQMWLRWSADAVGRSGRPTTLSSLLYSDGLKTSQTVPVPADPLTNYALDADDDNRLHDGERDADGDGLGNWDESHGKMTEAWWPAQHNGENEPKESIYPGINFLDNADLPFRDASSDSDVDGDGVRDGDDDYDHDGLSNQFEVRRPGDWDSDAWVSAGIPPVFTPGPNSWAYTNPFSPCKPYDSERCHEYPPFGHYDSDERPPIGPNPPGPPGAYPGNRPATPDG